MSKPQPIEKISELRLKAAICGGVGRSFRGEIYDYARTIELGGGYLLPKGNLCRTCRENGKKSCRHFEIDTCRQLVGIFKALNDPNVQRVMLLKAVQTLGSLVWDLLLHYLVVHLPYKRIKIFIDSIEKCDRYCDDRLMPTLRANPDIAPLIPREGMARHDSTKTGIKFLNGKTIEILALNDSNASSLSADFVVIDEGWEHGSDGLMQKAIDRTKQAKATGNMKVFIVGQAGNEKEDQDEIWKSLDKRVRATWQCPCCAGRQTFGERGPAVLRGDDFKPLPLLADLPPDILPPAEPPKAGTYAGLKVRGNYKEVTTPEEINALAATAFLECFHCGCEIQDTKKNRRALVDSFDQEYRVAGAGGLLYTPKNFTVGFWNPDPASETIEFKVTMLQYIRAKKSNEELGSKTPLRDFYQNRWATAWSEQLNDGKSERPGAAIYDLNPANKFPGERLRISATDIQFKLTHMVYLAVAVGDGTPPWLLHYEWVKPPAGLTDHQAAEHCKARVRALDKQFGIQPQNSMKDAAHEPGLVREWAAEDAVWGKLSVKERPHWIAYGLLLGDDRVSYKWVHPGRKDTWERFKQYHWHKVPCIKDGKRVVVDVHHRLWSNYSIKEIAERWLKGEGAPKLQIHEQWLKDSSSEGLWAMLTSERLIPWKGHPGKLHYNNEGRPNHAWDCWCMAMERVDELGWLNSFGAPPEDNEP